MKSYYLSLLLCFSFGVSFSQVDIHPDTTVVTFKCVDQEKVPEDSTEIELFDESGKSIIKTYSNVYGIAKFKVKRGVNYGLKTSKYGTTKNQAPINCANAKMNVLLKINFYDKEFSNMFELDVFFKSNEHSLDFEDYAALNALFRELQKEPKMKIEIAAHTDNVGNDRSNMSLSQRRANSVRTYLEAKGIAKGRIFSKGYGEKEPKASNETEEGRASNRRVEVRVLAK